MKAETLSLLFILYLCYEIKKKSICMEKAYGNVHTRRFFILGYEMRYIKSNKKS